MIKQKKYPEKTIQPALLQGDCHSVKASCRQCFPEVASIFRDQNWSIGKDKTAYCVKQRVGVDTRTGVPGAAGSTN
jgi:hypothetical protein